MLSGCQLKQNKNLLKFTLGIRKLSKITLLNLNLFILYSQIRYNTLQIAVKSHITQIMMQDCSNQGIHFEFVLTS